MGDFKITVLNNTGQIKPELGRAVNVMLFQTQPDPLTSNSYSTAWKVRDIQYPGSLGPIDLPAKVEFYVIDHPKGDLRKTGPFQVAFGDIVIVTQKNADDAPLVENTGPGQPGGEIKVINASGNAQALEMALFKNGSKMVSLKDITPGLSAFLSIKPAIYIATIQDIIEGEEFVATTQSTRATMFNLPSEFPDVMIQITQEVSGELVFSLEH